MVKKKWATVHVHRDSIILASPSSKTNEIRRHKQSVQLNETHETSIGGGGMR